MSTVATANNRDCRCFNVIFFLDERNNEGSEFTLVPVATIRIVACHRDDMGRRRYDLLCCGGGDAPAEDEEEEWSGVVCLMERMKFSQDVTYYIKSTGSTITSIQPFTFIHTHTLCLYVASYFFASLFLSAHFLVIKSGMNFKLAIFSQNLSVKSEMIPSAGLALAALGLVAFLS